MFGSTPHRNDTRFDVVVEGLRCGFLENRSEDRLAVLGGVAARVGGRMLLLRGGNVVGDGDAVKFAESDLLKEAYFGQDQTEDAT